MRTIKEIKKELAEQGETYLSYQLKIGGEVEWHDYLVYFSDVDDILYVNTPQKRIGVNIDNNEGLEANLNFLNSELCKYLNDNFTVITKQI